MPRHLTVVQLLDGKLALAGTGDAFMARVNKDTLILVSVTLKYDAPPLSSGLMHGSRLKLHDIYSRVDLTIVFIIIRTTKCRIRNQY